MSDKPTTFVREATGLVRALSVTDVFLFNAFNSAIGVTIAFMPAFFAGVLPNSNPLTSIVLGAIVALSSGWVLMMLSAAMPRSGGDYIYNTRIIHPSVGFVTSFIFVISETLFVGLYTSWIATLGLSSSLLNLGAATGNQALLRWGGIVATPSLTVGIGIASMVIMVGIMLLGTRATGLFMKIVAIPAFAGLVVLFAVLATSSHHAFLQAFNSFAQPYTNSSDSYTYFINTAKSAGYSPATITPLSTAYGAIFSGILLFIGYQFSIYLAGEVKRNERSQPLGIIGALVVTALVLIIADVLWYNHVVGADITNSLNYLSVNSPANYTLPAPISYPLFAELLTHNLVLLTVLSVSFTAWFLMLPFVILLEYSRVIFSWSFDRMIPSTFSNVNSRGSPTLLIVVLGALAAVFLTVYSFVLNITFLVNTTLLSSVVFIIQGISAILLPVKQRAVFTSAPKMVRWSIGKVPVLGIMGAVNVAIYGVMIYLANLFPSIGGPTGAEVYLFIVAIVIVGFVFYAIAYSYNKRRGINIDLMFKELPPE